VQSERRLEVHYHLKDNRHSMDAIVRNRCEADFLAAMKYITEKLGAQLVFEATVPTEGGFRDQWKVLWGTETTRNVLITGAMAGSVALAAAVINGAVAIYNAPPKPDPVLEEQQKEINRLAIEKAKLENKKLAQEVQAMAAPPAVAASAAAPAPRQAASSPSGLAPQKLSLQTDWKVRKLRSEFYKRLINYDTVEAVGFSLRDSADVTQDQYMVRRQAFTDFVLATDKLEPKTTEAVIEIYSPVITDSDLKWKGKYGDKVISFTMEDKAFRNTVMNRNTIFGHGDRITCVLVTDMKLDDAGEAQVAGYRVTTVIAMGAGEDAKETPQGRQKRFEDKFADSQNSLFPNGDAVG
jgi:hypothetical protein